MKYLPTAAAFALMVICYYVGKSDQRKADAATFGESCVTAVRTAVAQDTGKGQ